MVVLDAHTLTHTHPPHTHTHIGNKGRDRLALTAADASRYVLSSPLIEYAELT